MNAKQHIERAEELLHGSEPDSATAGVHATLASARLLLEISEWVVLASAVSIGKAAGIVVPGVPERPAS